jgi:hypothetical protein
MPEVALLNDYVPLINALFAESFSVSDRCRVDAISGRDVSSGYKTKLDDVKRVWESLFPRRKLTIYGAKIQIQNITGGAKYSPVNMSDGERALFYLVGECMCAPHNGMIIVDEPELHLHKALQATLWNEVERARPDLTFVYITHDLDFASSRVGATKIWLKEYSNNSWSWEELNDEEGVPEPLLLQILGSRKPVIFVEGDPSSLDALIYGRSYPGYTIIPCGNCESVIRTTKSFRSRKSLHNKECFGVTDNDGKSPEEIEALKVEGIGVLDVALIENLFLVKPVLKEAGNRLGHDVNEVLSQVHSKVLERLSSRKEQYVSNLCKQEIEWRLGKVGDLGKGRECIISGVNVIVSAINVNEIYDKLESLVDNIISKNDYHYALRVMKEKGLPTEINSIMGVIYKDQIVRWISGTEGASIIEAMRPFLPKIEELAK